MQTQNPTKTYYPALDGLRGLAILLVVFYHNFGFIPHSNFGWLGVDLFFVLSGFLITSILIKDSSSKGFISRFYIRRSLRIFPLYFLTLIIFLLLFPALGLFKKELAFFVKHQAWLWTYLQNWLYSFRLTENAKILTHLWSLAVEEQFYLLWPIIILIFPSPKKLLFIMFTVLIMVLSLRSLIWMQRLETLNYTTLYTFTRIDGICIGSIVAILQHYKPFLITRFMSVIVLALAFMNLLFYFLSRTNDFPYFAFVGYTTFCALFGILVHEIVNSRHQTIFHKSLSLKPLRFFGKISYGFYVFHWPIFLLTRGPILVYLQTKSALPDNWLELISTLTSTALAIMISMLSFHYFESHFLKLKNKFA